MFKMAYVTPIHKGGSRQKPEQYRLVSLTSHIMKIFERVIKLVKPQVSEAVALPQIYADLIQDKGLFKYYITHFWTVLYVHPSAVTVFLALIEYR